MPFKHHTVIFIPYEGKSRGEWGSFCIGNKSSCHFQEYSIKVQRGHQPEQHWTICKRYSDFVTLNDQLKVTGIDLPLPPKKVFGNREREFIAERQQGLQTYLNVMLGHRLLASALPTKLFLDAENYKGNLQGKSHFILSVTVIHHRIKIHEHYYLLQEWHCKIFIKFFSCILITKFCKFIPSATVWQGIMVPVRIIWSKWLNSMLEEMNIEENTSYLPLVLCLQRLLCNIYPCFWDQKQSGKW